MAPYLVQVAYTPEAWATLMARPQDRIAAIRPVIEGLGGKVEAAYFTFGDYDLIAIMELPGNVEAAAFAIAASAGGAVRAFKTTPLLSLGEAIEAMGRAGKAGYKVPSRSRR
jgi:uncharacterized protein with GYD domain